MGGLSRKAFQIKQSKKNIPTVAVDGGAFFFNQLTLTAEPELTIAREKAAGMARASMEMDMDGMGVAPLDLAAGSDFLKRVARDNNLPLLSMNLFDRDTKETIFPRYRVVQAGDLQVAILGLTDNLPIYLQKKYPDMQILPWDDILPEVLSKLEEQVDIIILLSSLSRENNRIIAGKFKEINLIVNSGHRGGNTIPENINNTLLLQTSANGKFLGMLEINWSQNLSCQFRSEDNQEGKLDNGQEEKQEACTYTNRFIALSRSLSKDSIVQKILNETKYNMRQANQSNRETSCQNNKKRQPLPGLP